MKTIKLSKPIKLSKRLMKINEIPFELKFHKLIERGIKTTTIRTLKYSYEDIFDTKINGICKIKNSDLKIKILNKRPITVPADINEDIVKSEGFKNKEELLKFFRRYNLPQTMMLYTFKMVENIKRLTRPSSEKEASVSCDSQEQMKGDNCSGDGQRMGSLTHPVADTSSEKLGLVQNIIEELAEIEHTQWQNWAKVRNPEHPLLNKKYSELTEEQKELDRIWARKIIEIFSNRLEKLFDNEKKCLENCIKGYPEREDIEYSYELKELEIIRSKTLGEKK